MQVSYPTDPKIKEKMNEWKAQHSPISPASSGKCYASTNEKYSKNPDFVALCELAEVKPSSRQASKYRNGKGKVYNLKF